MSAPPAPALAHRLRPLTSDPSRSAILCDIDGTLAPIVDRPEDSRVPEEVADLLGRLERRYATVACVSGRAALDARRLVGVDAIAYVGSHGAELLRPRSDRPELIGAFAGWEARVAEFAAKHHGEPELERLHVRLEDKGAIRAYHWRGAPDEEAAQGALADLAQGAEAAGLYIHWGRKVLEVRPPVAVDKGRGVRELLRSPVRAALYGGDDATDLDAFEALDELVAEGELDAAVRVGVRSAEGPEAIVSRADVAVEGVEGFTGVLSALAEAP